MTLVATCICVLALLSVTTAKIVWNPLKNPKKDARHKITFSKSAAFDGNQMDTQFQTLQRPSISFGGHVTKSGLPLLSEAGETYSNYPDFSSLLNLGIEEGENNVLYSVTHFESGYPSSAYLTKILQSKEDGELTAVSNSVVNFTRYHGVMNPGAGSVTPWMTHLGSEINAIDGRIYDTDSEVSTWQTSSIVVAYLAYMELDVSVPADIDEFEVRENFKPYKYGYNWEARVDTEGVATAVKMFSMGRTSAQQALIMPDRRTVYMSIDSSNKPFLKFVANNEND